VASSTAATTENHTDARAIVEESQRRSEARFYQYDGLLQSYDTNNTVTEKRWCSTVKARTDRANRC
jgi:ATP phosphoribosyltransferase regulatory subunit HisZ